MASQSNTASAISSGIGIAIAIVLLFVGLKGVYSHWLEPSIQFQRSTNWTSVLCTVQSIRLDEINAKNPNAVRYVPTADFQYEFSGKEYTSKRFWFGSNETTDKQTAMRLMAPFAAGMKSQCSVDPANPSEAVLVKELNPPAAWMVRNYAITAGIGAIMLLGQLVSLLMRCVNGVTVSEKNLMRAMTNSTCPVESGDPDQPLIIQAAESRVAVALGLWIGGICWLGIVTLIGSFVLRGKDWIPYLFIGGFTLIGVALLVAAIYSTLQVFNPRPILACSQRDIYPGSEFELSWMFRGNVKKIQQLEIVIEGTEKVSYRQGTSTRTEEKPFFHRQIVNSPAFETISQGFEIVTIPIDTMHTFKSTNNAFTWQIRVHGKIPFWPNIRDRFEIVLLAPLPLETSS